MSALKTRRRKPDSENGAGTPEDAKRVHSELRRQQTPTDVGRRVGFVALWAVVAIVGINGIQAIFSGSQGAAPASAPKATWPGSEAESFGLDFARTYLSFGGSGEDATDQHAAEVAPFLTPAVRSDVSNWQEIPPNGATQVAYDGHVVRSEALGPDHALVVVEALVQQTARRAKRRVQTTDRVFLGVPVGRDKYGRIAVYAQPSVLPEPPKGEPEAPTTSGISEPGVSEINDLVERFMRDFVRGVQAGDLARYVARGATVPSLGSGYRLLEVESVDEVSASEEGETPPRREVVARARARDEATGTIYSLTYRLELVRRDRWYIERLAGLSPPRAAPTKNKQGGK